MNRQAASYGYDADGDRTSVSSANPTVNYVVDTSLPYASVVEEYNGTALAARYDYGDDLIRMDRGPVGSQVPSYYLYDGLGSTRQLVNTSGAVTDSYGYSAFGEIASRIGGTTNSFLFNAQQFDGASGDYYLRARYYNQSSGRFISQDPYGGSNNDPVSLHRYLYAANDPVDYYDLSGRETEGEVLEASLDSQTIEGRSASFYYKIVGTFIVGNPFALQNAALFVIGLVDPEFAFQLEGTFPQGDLGATGGIATSSAFKQLGRALRGVFNADSAVLSDQVIGTAITNLLKDHPPAGGAIALTRGSAISSLVFKSNLSELVVAKKGVKGADIVGVISDTGETIKREVFVRQNLPGTALKLIEKELEQTEGADFRQFVVQVGQDVSPQAARGQAEELYSTIVNPKGVEIKFVGPSGNTLYSNFSQ